MDAAAKPPLHPVYFLSLGPVPGQDYARYMEKDWRAYPYVLHVELETGSHLSYGYATAVLPLPEHYLLFPAVQGLVRPMQNLDRVLHVE